MTGRGATLKSAAAVLASQVLARVVVIARGIASAAALGPHGYGGWNALNLIFDYGSYATLGALQGLDLRLPGAVHAGDAARARRLMAGAWAVVVLGGAAFSLLLVAYLAMGGRAFSTWPGGRLPLLMLAAALLQLVFQYLASALKAHGRFREVSLGQAIQAVAGGGLGIAWVWSAGAFGLLVGWLAGTALALIVMARAAPEAPRLPAGLGAGFDLVKAGLPIFGYFMLTLVLRSVDRMALLRFGGEEPLGLYGLGLMIAGVILYLPEALATVLFPRMAASSEGARDASRTHEETLRAQRGLALLVPVVAGVGTILAGPVVATWLPDYVDGLESLRVLAIGAMFVSAATLPGYALLAGPASRALVARAAVATAAAAVLAFAVAAWRPEPTPLAVAAAAGQGLFAAVVLSLAASRGMAGPGARFRWVALQLLPALNVGIVVLALSRFGSDGSWGHAALRVLALLALSIPLLWGAARELRRR